MDSPLNSTQVAQFLGAQPEFEVPFPRIGNFQNRPGSTDSDHRARSADPGNSNTSKGYRLGDRLPICITGQIRRLELQSKIQRLIQPALRAGHNVEVYLVLDPRVEHTAYIHNGAGETVRKYSITEGSFHSLKETVDRFPSNITVVFDPFIPKDYPMDPRYAKMMRRSRQKLAGGKRGMELNKHRSQSHMRQWEALDRCWQLILARDPVQVPQMAMRMRDDSAVAEEFVPFVESMPRGIYVPACESWGGANDKVCIISGAREVQKYFTKPLAMMLHNFSDVLDFHQHRTDWPINPESVLQDSMAMSDVPVFTQDYFPIKPVSMLQATANPQPKPKMCYLRASHTEKCFSNELWKRLSDEIIVVSKHDVWLCAPALDPFEPQRKLLAPKKWAIVTY
eukprot:Skav214730  [mRNA]  locus=scaffold2250:510053:511237:+ [translate_table: standard]